MASYVAGLPKAVDPMDAIGYTEEEQFDDLRNMTAFAAPDRRKAIEA